MGTNKHIKRLFESGISINKIIHQLDVSRNTVLTYLREESLKESSAEESSNDRYKQFVELLPSLEAELQRK